MFMAFNKLAFVLVLAILSSGEEDLELGTFYYNSNEIDSNGYLQVKGSKKGSDADTADTPLFIRDFKAFVNGTKYTDDSFQIFPDADFNTLVAAKDVSQIGCYIVKEYYDSSYYTLLGFAAKFYENDNISPSFTWLLANAPTKRVYKDKPEEADSTWEDLDLEYSCTFYDHHYDFATPAIHKYGIVNNVCFPNDEVPTSLTTCAGTSTAPKALLKGYKFATFSGDRDNLKNILIRFGPVLVDGDVVIGWEKDGENQRVIYAAKESQFGNYSFFKSEFEGTTYQGYFFFNPDAPKPIDCATELTVSTTADECPCFDKKTDKESYDADIRKGGICKGASGSVRATLAVVAAVLFTPILALFW
ncbi:MAG: hypothetical protein EZS28_005699 [Streblomastix strix]|uniref:Uncharacterized protein n=1 Tax=Streblomastix strix TaxID=222440 RepID=A0A5J4WV25_9EUKA|nr:MAG: hypothetical protein EZS28_005699 [Streblomastix strix]